MESVERGECMFTISARRSFFCGWIMKDRELGGSTRLKGMALRDECGGREEDARRRCVRCGFFGGDPLA